MNTAILGHTGFVGSNLCCQAKFQDKYNSANIEAINHKSYNLIVCSAAPAAKWKANQNPQEDLSNIRNLMANLNTVRAEQFVLISTVDVYPNPYQVTEDSVIDPAQAEAYGKHRYYLEEFVRQKYPKHYILRLPGLFGTGLKKNFIYDLIHNNCLHLTHSQSLFQFYNLARLWADIQVAIGNNLHLLNLATEPVSASELASKCFNLDFDIMTEKAPARYDMRTKYSHLFGSLSPYLYSGEETYSQIRKFVNQYKTARVS